MDIVKRLKENKYYYFIMILLVVIIVNMISNGFLHNINLNLSDYIYQKKQNVDRKIVILGMDEESLEYFGPIDSWTRDIYADAIYLLNENPDSRPSAIGIDVTFSSYKDEEIDQYLAEACEEAGNVVVGSEAVFTDEIISSGDSFSRTNFSIAKYEEPYPELKDATKQGFINNMLDVDGIARSGILHIDMPDGERKDSFSYEIYKMGTRDNGALAERIPLMNSLHQWYVPYSFGPGDCETYSFSAVFTGEITGEELEDCIVLIGPYASTLNDGFLTSIDHAEMMYGIEIHANMIQAMINDNFKTYIPDNSQYIALMILLIGCIFFFRMAKLLYSTIVWFLLSAGYIGFAYILYQNGYILQVLYLPLLITILYVTAIASNYVKAAVEKRTVVNTFKRYVAPQVVDEIFNSGMDTLELGGKMTDIACLFVDIRGFTTISETLEPAQVVEILNRYLNLTNTCIMNNQGTLDKFIGDSTMAVFNAPVPLDDYIYKAVKTGWEMVQGSEQLRKEIEEIYGRSVTFGVGIHCGKAVVGNIGTSMRMDYTAIGDTVNTASRLESNAGPGQILISRAVCDALEGRIKAASLGNSIKLKGKSEEFEVLVVEEVL